MESVRRAFAEAMAAAKVQIGNVVGRAMRALLVLRAWVWSHVARCALRGFQARFRRLQNRQQRLRTVRGALRCPCLASVDAHSLP